MPRYFLLTIAYFWIPVVLMGLFLRGKLDPTTKKAFWITQAIFFPLSFAMEYVYLKMDLWVFTEQADPLLGIVIWGAPIEEFSFWWGALPFLLFMYLSFDWLLKKRSKQ